MCFRHAPQQYGAIHFHDDDLDDCGWQTDFTSGRCRPARGRASTRCALEGRRRARRTFRSSSCRRRAREPPISRADLDLHLHRLPQPRATRGDDGPVARARGRTRRRTGAPIRTTPATIAEYGLSTYNFHTDGSGICHASWLRPMLNVRIGLHHLSRPDDPRLGPAPLPGRHPSDRLAREPRATPTMSSPTWELDRGGRRRC